MNHTIRILRACLVGLITAQVLGTIQVYYSDLALYRTVKAVTVAGYLGVPNDLVLPSLLRFYPALVGGLFFTLSVGAGLTLLSLTGAWFWDCIFRRSRKFLFPLTVLWAVLIIAAAANGFDLAVLLYFVLIPPAIFIAATRSPKHRLQQEPPGVTHYLPAILLFILVLVWLPLAGHNLYINLRDYLLLTNPVGRMINDSYYRYTLYPAQVFKTLDQKTIKTVFLGKIEKKQVKNNLTEALLKHDYIPVSDQTVSDLSITTSGSDLVFQYKGKNILRQPLQDFTKHPDKTLRKVSGLTDRFAFFRTFTGAGVLIGFPIMLYILLFGLIFLLIRLILPPKQATILASLAVFLAGILLALPLYLGKFRSVEPANAAAALRSAHWQERLSGLRTMAETGKNPMKIVDIATVQKSFTVPERYWYVRAIGNSPAAKPRDLEIFLDDQSLNVVCMAYDGLGRRGTHQLIGPLLARLRREPHWYIQWYAYRTLRQIGWIQEQMKK